MTVVVVVVTAVSAVVPVSGTVVLMMAMEMEVGSQLAERHWRDFYAGCEVHTPLLARCSTRTTTAA
jgi:hypothetical protein